MKKITLILTICIICITSTFAQKYGHISSNEIMMAMPGIDSVQIKLAEFQESLKILHENMTNELQLKKEKLDKEAGTMSSAVRKVKEDEISSLIYRIQEFEYTLEDSFQEEQMKLVAPFEEKIMNAINDVAKENKYSYIFDTRTLLFYEDGDDVTPLVKKKLGIK
jgi:outer membrane protein